MGLKLLEDKNGFKVQGKFRVPENFSLTTIVEVDEWITR